MAISKKDRNAMIQQARKRARNEMPKNNPFATEGYFGGYISALDDVINLLNGVVPNRHGWWELKESTNEDPA